MPKLRIAEIFTSLQGEGQWIGIPSTFVRVSGCNMRCVWCDTPYASWRPEGPVLEVAEILETIKTKQVPHVVVTGGEPMFFDAIEPLLAGLIENGHVITIETAGTVFRDVPCHLMSISPKLANSTPADPTWTGRHEAVRLDRAPLAKLISAFPDYQLKFVVDPEGGLHDFQEIDDLLAQIGHKEPARVLIMAEGTDSETQHRRQRQLVEPCIERGWRLTPRLHIDLFGNTKGT